MIKIKIYDRGPTEIMEIVRELRSQGLVQGKDFDFAYNQSKWDEMIGEIPRHTLFTFYNDKQATMFALKFGSGNGT
jgi:hypothetical protein